MEKNLRFWDELKSPPNWALKKITGGRLKGMTDISPIWRMQAMTELFGPVGIGWNYQIKEKWLETSSDGQICAFALVILKYKIGDEEWSEWVEGIGGSMLVAQEKEGLHTSDEAFKMAVTDALSVAMKAIGVGADIYQGLNDGKYNKPPQPEKPESQPSKGTAVGSITIVNIESKSGTNKKGNPYTKYTITDSNGVKYGTFDKNIAERAEEVKQKKLPVEIESEDTQYGKDIKGIGVIVTDIEPNGELTPELCHAFAKEYEVQIAEKTTVKSLAKWWNEHEILDDIKRIEAEAYTTIKTAFDTKMSELKAA